jgi:hypothetical protein
MVARCWIGSSNEPSELPGIVPEISEEEQRIYLAEAPTLSADLESIAMGYEIPCLRRLQTAL